MTKGELPLNLNILDYFSFWGFAQYNWKMFPNPLKNS